MLPAPGQGALAVECRADDLATVELLRALDDPDARAAVTAERALLAALEAGCSAPVGALAEVVDGEDGLELSLRAFIGAVDGSFDLRRSLVGPVADAESIGVRLARTLLEDGAGILVSPGGTPLTSHSVPDHGDWHPEPPGATGDDPLAAPDRSPAPNSTERAL
jgi:hydroxymethylbilane synthase